MLALLSQGFLKIPINQLFPWDENDLAVAMSEQVIIVLRNILNEKGQRLSIKRILEEDKQTFGTQDFSERLESFAKLMPCFLERKFVTKKQDYIFFDDVEQNKIKEIFSAFAFQAECDLYVINKETHKIRQVEIENVSIIGWNKVKKYISKLGCVFVFGVDEGFRMIATKRMTNEETKARYQRPKGDDKKLKEYFEEFPELSGLSTLKEYKSAYKELCKKHHPDTGGDGDIFTRLQEADAYIQSTHYYKTLKGVK